MIDAADKELNYKSNKQLYLYEYSSMFNLFVNLIKKKKMPRCSILLGQKGLGKATFAYHLVNYLLSVNEQYKYLIQDNYINPDNRSYNLVNSNTHPNFFLINNKESENNIKITQVRSLLKFLKNTTYEHNLKIVLIDNAETLNLNAANALLKCLEEPTENTFFILVQNNNRKIIDTIKSRGIEFKFFLNEVDKKNAFNSLCKQHQIVIENADLFFEKFYFETPGNLIKFIRSFDGDKTNMFNNTQSSIYYLCDFFLKNESSDTLSYISALIEKFYNDLIQKNPIKNKRYFFNRTKILKSLNEMKIFNLDSKNTFSNIKDILETDAR